MTSRTTPVGILVIALIGLITVGCSAPTNAVFQALLDPAGTAVPSPEADSAVDPVPSTDTEAWWAHPDGYRMLLPAGWSGVAVGRNESDEILAAVSRVMPELGQRISDTLDGSKARVSAIAADPDADGAVSPVLLILAQPMDGRRPHAVKADVRERIGDLPGLSGPLSAHDVVLPTAKAMRFDYTIDDSDLGEMRILSYLFRVGRTAYLVSFAASPDVAADAEAVFDEIVYSLRFGL